MKPKKEQTKKVAGADGATKEEKPKSKTTLFWEKHPNGILRIIDMKAVLQ
jgi:hypothetical protein